MNIRRLLGIPERKVTPADAIIADLTYRLGVARAALSPFARAGRDPFFANADPGSTFKTDALSVSHLITAAAVYRETGLKDSLDEAIYRATERLFDEEMMNGVQMSFRLYDLIGAVKARRTRLAELGIAESTP